MEKNLEIDSTTLFINCVVSCKDANLSELEITWGNLRAHFEPVNVRLGRLTFAEYHGAADEMRKSDKDGPAWIPCSSREKSGRRCKENMNQMYLLVLDVDYGIELAEIEVYIGGWEALIHSSHSSTLDKRKWRILLPLLNPISANDLPTLFDRVQARFPVPLDASCGHDSAHLYYFPSCV